jgi:uncharacterized membrane protein
MSTSTDDSPARQGSRLAVALPWLTGVGMIVSLFPLFPVAMAAPEWVFGNVPVFLLLLLFGVSAAQQAREGASTAVLAGAVLGGLVAVVVLMVSAAGFVLVTHDPWAWVVYAWTPGILWVAGSGGAVLGAAVGSLVRRRRARRASA